MDASVETQGLELAYFNLSTTIINNHYMIKGIYFKNYKAFKEGAIDIRPITLLIGKNSSGKSSICKLLPLLSKSLTNHYYAPFVLDNDGVSVGAKYNDVFRNHANAGLVLGIVTTEGIHLESHFAINKGKLIAYSNICTQENTDPITLVDEVKGVSEKGLFSDFFLKNLGIKRNTIQMSVDYISPLRREAQYAIRFKGKGYCNSVGDDGSNAYDLLVDSYLDDTPLYNNVALWMQNNLEEQKLVIKRLADESEVFGFYIERGGVLVNLADVGQGVSQLLPIIVQSFLPSSHKADITVIEQPALHLHPAAHAAVAERLAKSVSSTKKKRYVIESHSENMLLCFRKLVHEKRLSANDIVVYFVHNDGGRAFLQKITIDGEGRLSSWPEGVFSEGFELLSSIYSE